MWSRAQELRKVGIRGNYLRDWFIEEKFMETVLQ
jgi:hypothetical protein